MYDKILPQKKRSGGGLKAALPLVFVFLALGAGLFIWGVRYEIQHRQFVSHLSNSNVYAYENRSLHADVRGTLVWAKRDNIQNLYNYILFSGSGRTCQPPEYDPEILVEYGDGSLLKIYEPEQEGFRTYLLYTHPDGFTYGYASKSMSVDTFAVTYLSLSDNAPWHQPVG